MQRAVGRVSGKPALMLASLIAACLLAVGHHVFYWRLHDKPVPDERFSQALNTAGGTAFAFLIKASLALTVGVAYEQILWQHLLRQRLRIATVDSLAALALSALELMQPQLLWQHPVLALLAVISWVMTLATVFTPGALSIRLTTHWTSNNTQVSMPNWSISNTVGNLEGDICPNSGTKYAPQFTFAAERLANIVQLSNSMPQIATPSVNTSYALDFFGPSIKCEKSKPPGFDRWCPRCAGDIWSALGYVAWMSVPNSSVFPVSLEDNNIVDCDAIGFQLSSLQQNYVSFDNGTVQLSVAIQSENMEDPTTCRGYEFFQCQLFNSSYTVNISSLNSQQQLHIEKTAGEAIYTQDYACVYDASNGNQLSNATNPDHGAVANYLSMMELLGQLMVGVVTMEQSTSSAGLNATLLPGVLQSTFSQADQLRRLYELVFWEPPIDPINSSSTAQAGVWGGWIDITLAPPSGDVVIGDLGPALEEPFTNWTLAMLNLPNMTHQHTTNVTFWGPKDIYQYSWRHLWISYGIGIGVTALIVALGCYTALAVNGASYSTNFSTYLRVVDWTQISDVVNAHDRGHRGADPLPKQIAEASVMLGQPKLRPATTLGSLKARTASPRSSTERSGSDVQTLPTDHDVPRLSISFEDTELSDMLPLWEDHESEQGLLPTSASKSERSGAP